MDGVNIDIGFFITVIIGIAILIGLIVLITSIVSTKKKGGISNRAMLEERLKQQLTENNRMQQELKQINSMDNLFFASMIRLTSRLHAADIAKEITGLLMNYLDAEQVAVFLADERGERLRIVDQHGIRDDLKTQIVYEVNSEQRRGKVGFSFLEKHPITKRDVVIGVQEPYAVFNPDICYPVFYQERRFGVIAIVRHQDLEERERNMLGVISAIAGITLNNTRTVHADPLTQLYNIGYFRERLDVELQHARGHQKCLSIAIVDLDNFKMYNDSYGHQAGDLLLMRLAQIFINHFDTEEIIARYGGDEFIVMFPGILKNDALRIMGHLLEALQKYDFASAQKVRVTFSAGISTFPDDALNATELIRYADQALYAAKRAGRNTVKMYSSTLAKI
ncbi:sensor domain-containing diguanylate cyclase [candidate division WOR-3 bacterium]|nr:sensor domain-containing diguanylate cyclase [candidate division WOR-3 bacterium]